ncbi:MAG: HAMP domain-containing histidine kinase [Candidatus Nitricoxidivorans perseverans]|uniref:histidine kinase n=1 Tax=Candidatus Nitricoxidivorans perseverans TaxID=2975601 RepID=A0AA49FKG5_9PROT|nr:MAG: HAMP domain-containing histidine kinase [Candidatus Nitricoxidivorans perseverans]
MDILFAAAIHDAKNVLNALNAALGEAGRNCPSPALDRARDMAARVSAQLVELLAIYREGQGSLRLAIDDHDVGDFLDDTLAELDAGPGGIVPACDPGPAREIGAWAFDAYQVRFVLLDALRNALRHARSAVRLSFVREPLGGVRFTVADNGPGFPESVLAGGQGAMSSASSGLGLTFARTIAERHATPDGRRGRVALENAPEGGARFSLILP